MNPRNTPPWPLTGALILAAAAALPNVAAAQDESSPSIELGSSRIGGRGLTQQERKRADAWDEPEEYLTEETLPPVGDKKRMTGLHSLAERYTTSKQYNEACEKFDSIVSEGGTEAVPLHPRGMENANRAYLECARIALRVNDFDKTEGFLSKSEKLGASGPKHAAIREKILRERYRKKLANGDISGALELFDKAQGMSDDEDERIWMGEQLADRAWTAYNSKNEMELKSLLGKLESVAPLNTEYRRLKEKIEADGAILTSVLMWCLAAVALVGGATAFSRWRQKARVLKATGGAFEEF